MLKNISCPSCSNNLQLNSAFIYQGMPILCSNCHYSWFYTSSSIIPKYKDLRQKIKTTASYNQYNNSNNNSYVNYLGKGLANLANTNYDNINHYTNSQVSTPQSINHQSVNYYKNGYSYPTNYSNNFTNNLNQKSYSSNYSQNILPQDIYNNQYDEIQNHPYLESQNNNSFYNNANNDFNYQPNYQTSYQPNYQTNYQPNYQNLPLQSNSHNSANTSNTSQPIKQVDINKYQNTSQKNIQKNIQKNLNNQHQSKAPIINKVNSTPSKNNISLQEKYKNKLNEKKIHTLDKDTESLKETKIANKENPFINSILQDINQNDYSNSVKTPPITKNNNLKEISHADYLENLINEIKSQSSQYKDIPTQQINHIEESKSKFKIDTSIHQLKQNMLMDEDNEEEKISKKNISKSKTTDLNDIVAKITKSAPFKESKDIKPQEETQTPPKVKSSSDIPHLNTDLIKNFNSNSSIKNNLNELFDSKLTQEQESNNKTHDNTTHDTILSKEELQNKYQKKNTDNTFNEEQNPETIKHSHSIHSNKELRAEKETQEEKETRKEKITTLKQATKELLAKNDINSWVNYFTEEDSTIKSNPNKNNPTPQNLNEHISTISKEINQNSPITDKLNLKLNSKITLDKKESSHQSNVINEDNNNFTTLSSELIFNSDSQHNPHNTHTENSIKDSPHNYNQSLSDIIKHNSQQSKPKRYFSKFLENIQSNFSLFSKSIPKVNPSKNFTNKQPHLAFSSLNSNIDTNLQLEQNFKINNQYSNNLFNNFFANKSLLIKTCVYLSLIILCSIFIYYADFLQEKNKDNTPQKIQISQATAKYLQSLSMNSELDKGEIEIEESFSSLEETENKKPTKLTVKYTKKDPKTAISLKEDPYKDPNSNITKTQKNPQELKQLSSQNNQNSFFNKLEGKINNAMLSISNTKSNFLNNVRVVNTISMWINKPFKSFETNIYLANSSSISVNITEVSLTIINLQGNIVAQKIVPINQIISANSSVNAILRLTDVPFNSYKVFATIKSYKKI